MAMRCSSTIKIVINVVSHIVKGFGSKARRLINSGVTNVVQSERDVPANIRNRLKPLSEGDGTIQGFYDPLTKKAYLIADNIKSMNSARGVFLHEEGVHAGMKGILGDKFDAIIDGLKQLKETGNEASTTLTKRYRVSTAEPWNQGSFVW